MSCLLGCLISVFYLPGCLLSSWQSSVLLAVSCTPHCLLSSIFLTVFCLLDCLLSSWLCSVFPQSPSCRGTWSGRGRRLSSSPSTTWAPTIRQATKDRNNNKRQNSDPSLGTEASTTYFFWHMASPLYAPSGRKRHIGPVHWHALSSSRNVFVDLLVCQSVCLSRTFFLHPGPAYWDLTLPCNGEGFMPSPFSSGVPRA